MGHLIMDQVVTYLVAARHELPPAADQLLSRSGKGLHHV